MIERKIIIGMIVSSDYLKNIRNIWDPNFLKSAAARKIAELAWNYFEKYDKAPGKNIESLFYQRLKFMNKELAEEIELDIMPSLSKEYETEEFNLTYTLDETQKYFKDRHLEIYNTRIESLRIDGKIDEAEKLACEYKPLQNGTKQDLDMSNDIVLNRIEKAFQETNQPMIVFPGPMGLFINEHLVKGGFVAFMGTEKRGKTYLLLELAIRAIRQGRKTAFFQAGDMTESQWLKRVCIYINQKSDNPKYCTSMWEPVRDCIRNQLNTCDKPERKSAFGVFEGWDEKDLKDNINLDVLVEMFDKYPDYIPCSRCKEYETERIGSPWLEFINEKDPLTPEEAKRSIKEFFINKNRNLRLSTHANDTLSVDQIRSILSIWEKQDDFVPEVIILDYADLLVAEGLTEERAKQNKNWKGLRRLSQEKGQPLVITATQADAAAYERIRLGLKNFSEDKRKYAHVTALWGINQDPKGIEKKLGLLRLNALVIREGDYQVSHEVTILQNLRRGKPFLGSFWR